MTELDYTFIAQFLSQERMFLLTKWRGWDHGDNTLEPLKKLMNDCKTIDGYTGTIPDHPTIKEFVSRRDNPSYKVTKEMLVGRDAFAHTAYILASKGQAVGKLAPNTWWPVIPLRHGECPFKSKNKSRKRTHSNTMMEDVLTHSAPVEPSTKATPTALVKKAKKAKKAKATGQVKKTKANKTPVGDGEKREAKATSSTAAAMFVAMKLGVQSGNGEGENKANKTSSKDKQEAKINKTKKKDKTDKTSPKDKKEAKTNKIKKKAKTDKTSPNTKKEAKTNKTSPKDKKEAKTNKTSPKDKQEAKTNPKTKKMPWKEQLDDITPDSLMQGLAAPPVCLQVLATSAGAVGQFGTATPNSVSTKKNMDENLYEFSTPIESGTGTESGAANTATSSIVSSVFGHRIKKNLGNNLDEVGGNNRQHTPPVRRNPTPDLSFFGCVLKTATNCVMRLHLLQASRIAGISTSSQKRMGYIVLRSISENRLGGSAHGAELTQDQMESLHSKLLRIAQNLRAAFNKHVKAVIATSSTVEGGNKFTAEGIVTAALRVIAGGTLSMDFMRDVFSMSCYEESVSVKQMQLVLLHVVLRTSWIQSGFNAQLHKNAVFILGKLVLNDNDLSFLAPKVKKNKRVDLDLFNQLNDVRDQTRQARSLMTTNCSIQNAIKAIRHVRRTGSLVVVKSEVKSENTTTEKEVEMAWLKYEVLKGSGKATKEQIFDAEMHSLRLTMDAQKKGSAS
jgi:hypothetical protein